MYNYLKTLSRSCYAYFFRRSNGSIEKRPSAFFLRYLFTIPLLLCSHNLMAAKFTMSIYTGGGTPTVMTTSDDGTTTLTATRSDGANVSGVSSGFLDPGVMAGAVNYTVAFNVPITITSVQIAEFTNNSTSNPYVMTPSVGTPWSIADNDGALAGSVTTHAPADWVGVTSLTYTYSASNWRTGIDNLVFTVSNLAPTASSFTALPTQGSVYTFSTADFSYSDGDTDPIDHLRVAAIPANGTLYVDANGNDIYNNGEELSNSDSVSKANLDAGNLQYYNTDGVSSSFTFDVNDGVAYSSSTYTATLTVDALPAITSVSVPANATYIMNQHLDFTVNFDESVTVNTAGGTPQLSLTIGAITRQAAYVSGSGSGALLFRYTVQSGDNDSDGIAIGVLAANGGSLRDSASNDALVTLNSVGATNAVLVDALISAISSVSVPNTAHKVGDTITATITVSSDSDDYTTGSGGISGSIAGYALGSLSKINNTTYTATFTMTDGGTDVAAGSNIPVNFTLTDSVGNTGSAYTAAISQSSDALYANLPDVDLTASSNTIAENGGNSILTATLSGSLNNQWPINIAVNLAYSGTATAITDFTKADGITISAGNSTGTSIVTGVADMLYDAALSETVIVDIGSVSVGNEGGLNQQTISITDAESAPTVSLSVGSNTIIENGGTSTVTASVSHPTYENVTVNLAYSGTAVSGTDYSIPSATIVIAAGSTTASAVTGINSIDDASNEESETIIIDISSVTGGGAIENAVQQQIVTLTDDDNVASVITSTAVTTVDEDALYSYTFTVTDTDAGDTLTLSAPTLPAWLNFTANTGVLSGTPTNDDVGPHVVKLRVNDGTVDVDQDFTISVSNINDAPTITGTPMTSAVEGVAYSFTVIGGDIDVGASLSYLLSNQPTWLSVNASGVVSGTPENNDVGTASNIVVSVTDGSETTSLPSFTISVDADMDGDGIGNTVDTDIDGDGMSNNFEAANGLDPLNPSDASGDLDGDGISNLDEFINDTNPLVDDYGPVISLNSNVVIDAEALLTNLPDGLASAIDALDGEVMVTHDLASELLKPGRYTINWSAEDTAGNTTTETQILDVRPIANWQVDQETSEGNTVTVSLYLNGVAPEYPVVADYTVLGTATTPEDHDAMSGSLTITEGRRASIILDIVSDASFETDETIIFELDSITNAVAGVKQEHIVTISELNHPPAVTLFAALDSAPAKKLSLFSIADGMATITATVSDVDVGDTHTFEWLGGNKLNGTVSGNTYSFDPAAAGKGVYQLTVKASDDASNPKNGSAVITLTVLNESLILSNTVDSDDDGIDDLTEGSGDNDGDNVPDFADSIEESNLLSMYPTGGVPTNGAWFVETQAGLSLKLNLISSGSAQYSPLLNAQQVVDEEGGDQSDNGYIYNAGIFDFVVSNMPVPGEMVLVVIPQGQAIPENPVYRKLIDNTWSEYVVDANNTLQSAAGKLGVCPPPGSDEYTDGLIEGYFCVQLGIEDGGSNDADGEANGTILDPGGIGQGIGVRVRSSGGAMSYLLLLLLPCLALIFRRRKTNHLRKGV